MTYRFWKIVIKVGTVRDRQSLGGRIKVQLQTVYSFLGVRNKTLSHFSHQSTVKDKVSF